MGKRRYKQDKATKAVGLKVREIRNKKGWTLEQCEEYGWPNWTHLRRIEAGKNITLHTLVQLANLFGIHPSELLEDL